jgi:hypothetical protein
VHGDDGLDVLAFTLPRLTDRGDGRHRPETSRAPRHDGRRGGRDRTCSCRRSKGRKAPSSSRPRRTSCRPLGASPSSTNPILVWDFDRPRSKPLIIAAGATNGIAVKNLNAIAAATVFINVWLDESNFA